MEKGFSMADILRLGRSTDFLPFYNVVPTA